MLTPEEKEKLESFTNHVRSGDDITSAFLGGYLVGLVLKLDKENDVLRTALFPHTPISEQGPLAYSEPALQELRDRGVHLPIESEAKKG